MNNINLLFDYRGIISAQQFKRAIYIILVICGLMILLNSLKIFDYYMISSTRWSTEQSIVETLFSSFTPAFIYWSFIIFYCSFVIGIKRGRAIGLSSLKRNIYSTLVYLFFTGISIIITFILPQISPFTKNNSYGDESDVIHNHIHPLYTALIVISCFVLVGCFVIVNLSTYKKSESKDYLSSTSIINYKETVSLFISILLIGIAYYGGFSFISSSLSPIHQTLITGFRDIIITVLAAWIAFRIIVPDNREMNTCFSLFNNQIIKLLFDWRGGISKHEFWAGIIITGMCLLSVLQGNVWQTINTFVVSNTYQGEGFSTSAALMFSLFNQLKPSFFPYGCIIFYSTILLSVKRCRVFRFNIIWGYILGISFYLSLAGFSALVDLSKLAEETSLYFNIVRGCCLLVGICVLISIIGIIIFSTTPKHENNHSSTRNNPIQYILSNGWLILFWLIGMTTLYLGQFSIDSELYLTGLIIVYIAYITIFVILSIDRIQDAGLSKNWVIMIVSLFVITQVTYYIVHEYKLITDTPIIYVFEHFVTSLITSGTTAFSFLLFLLPSQSKQ